MPIFKQHPCPICGTIRYKRSSESGYVCRNGHEMIGVRRQEGDENEGRGRHTRRKVRERRKTQRLYGNAARDAARRVMQHTLQFLCRIFIQDLGMPPEFEYIVRELWFIYVSKNITLSIDMEDDDDDDVARRKALYTSLRAPGTTTNDNDDDNDDELNPEDLLEESDEEGRKADAAPTTQNDHVEEDNRIENRQKPANAGLSDESVKHLRQYAQRVMRSRHRTSFAMSLRTREALRVRKQRMMASFHAVRRKKYLSFTPLPPRTRKGDFPPIRIFDTILFCYLGAVYLGWPILTADIHRWSCSLRVPVLTAIKSLPRETIANLPAKIHTTQLQSLPKLRDTLRDYLNAFEKKCNIDLPEPNVSLLIYRFIKQFYLPVEMYFCAKALYDDYCPPIFVAGAKTLRNEEVRTMIIVLFLVNACYDLGGPVTNPYFSNYKYAPPMPKAEWLVCVKANVEKWTQYDESQLLTSSKADISQVIAFIKQGVVEKQDAEGKRHARSLVRSYLTQSARQLGMDKSAPTNWSNDMLSDVPKPDLTRAAADAARVPARLFDLNRITRYNCRTRRETQKEFLFPEEYALMIDLASRILGWDTMNLHIRLQSYHYCLHLLVQ
ncbi:hypothetical protein BC940DRAFT_274647 [Gongronella butleri]|nr:hypothetical protein BC940DRAFT_274647 [Gongronella butleri]